LHDGQNEGDYKTRVAPAIRKEFNYMKAATSKAADTLKPSESAQGVDAEETRPVYDSVDLPEQPLTVVEPHKAWVPLNVSDLWAHRELLYFLVWRDIKVRYKQTLLGAAWAVLQPLFMMVVFTLFFGRIAGVASQGIPYPLFAFAGLVPWTFFANAVTNSSNSLVGNANLITKVYFPRLIVPTAAILAGLVDFALAFLLLIVMVIYYRATDKMRVIIKRGLRLRYAKNSIT
jgi:lipopolysaccharide transport system permease protein